MSRSRSKLKPHERARSDQYTAAARNIGAVNPTTAVFALEFADATTGQCCWCDCPDTPDSPHYQPGFKCGGCSSGADYVLHAMYGTPRQQDYPVCEGHQSNLQMNVARLARSENGCVPVEIVTVSVLDADPQD